MTQMRLGKLHTGCRIGRSPSAVIVVAAFKRYIEKSVDLTAPSQKYLSPVIIKCIKRGACKTSFIASVGIYFWNLIKIWIETFFVLPFQNWEMLWILVPVWIAWFFAEFFQEKTGTSLGNAITNAVVVLWGSIDCSRQTVYLITTKTITSTADIIGRFALIGIIFSYGVLIVVLGIKANKFVKYLGRVRVVSYVFAMFIPVFYNAIPFSVDHLIALILFFPIFYFVIEIIDRIIPDPKAIVEDSKPVEKKPVAVNHTRPFIRPETPAAFNTRLREIPQNYPERQKQTNPYYPHKR